mgnify:CR=1 FL=1
MFRPTMPVTLSALALSCLALSGCPEEGKELMNEAREAHSEAVNEVGGAPKRQVDHAAKRINAAAEKNADRLNIPTE